jgi:hypothetical protein
MAKSTPYSSDIFLKTYNTETGSSSSNDVYLSKFGEIVMNNEGIKKCIDELRLKRIQLRVGSGIEITLHRSCTEIVYHSEMCTNASRPNRPKICWKDVTKNVKLHIHACWRKVRKDTTFLPFLHFC